MAKDYKVILSIDGGGIRGIIPLCLLVELERQTGKLARDVFSFAGGTSTGALITAAIAAGIPADKVLESYIETSNQLFQKPFLGGIKRFFWGYLYSSQKLNYLIKKQLGNSQDWVINNSPIDLLITAKRVRDGMPWYFVKDNPKNSQRTGNLLLSDCTTASASAPTYFEPWTIKEDLENLPPGWDPVGTLTDGGVGVTGNPVYQTCVEAFYFTGKYQPNNTIIVSLGTGRFIKESMPVSLLEWTAWALGELSQSTGEQQTQLVQRHFNISPFYRLDPDLMMLDPNLNQSILLDDATQAARLQKYGEKFAKEIDWKQILKGEGNKFSITSKKTQWKNYKWP